MTSRFTTLAEVEAALLAEDFLLHCASPEHGALPQEAVSAEVIAPQMPIRRHVMEALYVNGQWWPQCCCGYQALPFQTIQAALSCRCLIENGEMESRANSELLRQELAR